MFSSPISSFSGNKTIFLASLVRVVSGKEQSEQCVLFQYIFLVCGIMRVFFCISCAKVFGVLSVSSDFQEEEKK